ncbi:hypothetical protein Micbo1qcDRAFT_189991 [Microdochium bolleyi]|uniref:Zn(2)-C6 fungal-type domain-containing protein n=1 Tax=Microdochium bolleyi TaxID=196109 RepID=A0A136ITD3_9PEZI|nr:hypothetical protein Micbo1qcDRAFT_189991 [Microdochium bolleyi]
MLASLGWSVLSPYFLSLAVCPRFAGDPFPDRLCLPRPPPPPWHAMRALAEMNALSCSVCRRRKVRCDRVLPSCDRCTLAGSACSYPQRRPRGPARAKDSLPSNGHDALATILEQLRRIEPASVPRRRANISGTPICAGPNTSAATTPRTQDFAAHSPSASTLTSSHVTATGSVTGLDDSPWFNATSVLNTAVSDCQRLVKRRFTSNRAFVTSDAGIPLDLTKAWVETYFATKAHTLFFAARDELFTKRPLLRMMPELTIMEHVQVDACVLVIYYCILQQGSFSSREATQNPVQASAQMMGRIYLCCLRAVALWQHEATGSLIDFVAAVLMAQTATENFDFKFSIEMHFKACSYAQSLNLHSLDSEDNKDNDTASRHDDEDQGSGLVSSRASDDRRMNMWNLIQIDLLYRLVHHETPAFSFDFSHWHVNLPSITLDPDCPRSEAVPAMTFLARTRVALILVDFFQLADDPRRTDEMAESVLDLCTQIEVVAKEWKILDWFASCEHGDMDAWVIADVALSCYTSILFMLRAKPGTRRATAGKTLQDCDNLEQLTRRQASVSLSAARKVLDIVCHMINTLRFAGSETLSVALCCFRAHVAYSHLAQSLVAGRRQEGTTAAAAATATPAARRDDVDRLRAFWSCVEKCAQQGPELRVLADALEAVYTRVTRS